MKTHVLLLTDSELDLLRIILGYVDAGDISGGPLEGLKHQQTTANIRVYRRICQKVEEA